VFAFYVHLNQSNVNVDICHTLFNGSLLNEKIVSCRISYHSLLTAFIQFILIKHYAVILTFNLNFVMFKKKSKNITKIAKLAILI